MWRASFILACFILGLEAARLPSLKDDTTCSIPETEQPSCRIDSYRMLWHNRIVYRMQFLIFLSSYPHLRWYQSELHTDHLAQWMQETATSVEQIYDCVDVFGASQRIVDTWMDAGWNAIGFDIKIDQSHDVCSERGVKTLLKMGLQLLDSITIYKHMHIYAYVCICKYIYIYLYIHVQSGAKNIHTYTYFPPGSQVHIHIYTYIDRFTNTRVNTLKNVKEQIFPFVSTTLQPRLKNGGMLTCAPPCSLFVPACSSVHRRTFANPEGNQAILKVRLAQRIWKNMDSWIRKSIGIKGQPICRSLACAREVVVSPGQPLHFVVSAQAECLRLIFRFRPSLHYLLEQPSGSWGLKQPFMISLAAAFHMCPSMI